MGVLSDFFIADRSTVPDYCGGEQLEDEDKCQYKRLTPLQAAQLLAVLRKQEYHVGLIGEFQLVTPEEAEEWTMSVPEDMVAKLAEIEEADVRHVAEQFAEATADELGWSPDDFVPIVTALAALARRAIESGKAMYLWNCL
jgi:hypothetical protein